MTEQRRQQSATIHNRWIKCAPSMQSVFKKDMCKCNALLSADNPLEKLNNVVFKHFLEQYTGKIITAVSTLRKNGVKDLYDSAINKIKDAVRDQLVWMSID